MPNADIDEQVLEIFCSIFFSFRRFIFANSQRRILLALPPQQALDCVKVCRLPEAQRHYFTMPVALVVPADEFLELCLGGPRGAKRRTRRCAGWHDRGMSNSHKLFTNWTSGCAKATW